MKTRLRRTFTLFLLMAALTATFAAQAQPPLAAPDGPGERIEAWPPAIAIYSPTAGKSVTYPNALVWSNDATPHSYRIRVVVTATGESFKFSVPLTNCDEGGTCSITAGATPMFDHLRDGDEFSWQVIARFELGKVKSAARHHTAVTVVAPQTLFPADGANLLPVHNLTWDASFVNVKYTAIVRDVETKAVAQKYVLDAGDCDDTCAVHPQSDGLQFDTPYQWFVHAKGYNGDKAKSHKQQFTIPSQASVR